MPVSKQKECTKPWLEVLKINSRSLVNHTVTLKPPSQVQKKSGFVDLTYRSKVCFTTFDGDGNINIFMEDGSVMTINCCLDSPDQ